MKARTFTYHLSIFSVLFLGLACGGTEEAPTEGASAGECIDGIDNDLDGVADCDDIDCQSWAVCSSTDTGHDDTQAPDTQDSPMDTGTGPAYDTQLCINEFMASNGMTIADEYGEYVDWIELFSMADHDIDLGGYSITDDFDAPDKHILADGTILPAGGFLLLWADANTQGGPYHLSFALAQDGEEIGLYTPDGVAINKLVYEAQVTDWSAARVYDGAHNDSNSDTGGYSSDWFIDDTPTPGQPNE